MIAGPEEPMEPPIDMPPTMESIEAFRPPTAPKERLGGAIRKAKETIIGSGPLGKEIRDTGEAYKKTLTTPPKALWKLVSGHPIKAIREASNSFKNALGSAVKTATLPTRLPFGALRSSFRVFGLLGKGISRLRR